MKRFQRSPFNEFVASELRAELARQDVGQRLVAEHIGVGVEWVSSRLRGHVRLTVDDVFLIASAVGVETGQVMAAAHDRLLAMGALT